MDHMPTQGGAPWTFSRGKHHASPIGKMVSRGTQNVKEPATQHTKRAVAHDQYDEIEEALVDPQAFLIRLLPKAKNQQHRAQLLFNNYIRYRELRQKAYEGMAIVKGIIKKEESWRYLDIDDETMWTEMKYGKIIKIKPATDGFRKTDARIRRALVKIEASWGSNWRSALDPRNSILPAKESEHVLGALSRLSQRLEADRVRRLLSEAIEDRLTNWQNGRRTTTRVTRTDLRNVEERLKKGLVDLEETSRVNREITSDDDNNGEEDGSRTTSKRRRLRRIVDSMDGDDVSEDRSEVKD